MQTSKRLETQGRANAPHVLLPTGEFTTEEVIELLPEILTANVERDPIRGGVLS